VLTFFCLIIIAASAIGFFYHRGFHYLRGLQHHEYNDKNLVSWLIANKVFDRKGSLIVTIAAAASQYFANNETIVIEVCIVAAIALAVLCFFEVDPRSPNYCEQQVSPTMNRIYWRAMLFCSLFTICLIFGLYTFHIPFLVPLCWLAVILINQSSPLWIILANRIVMKPNR
jgi:hypothetical protein